jgi:hypothetical protein
LCLMLSHTARFLGRGGGGQHSRHPLLESTIYFRMVDVPQMVLVVPGSRFHSRITTDCSTDMRILWYVRLACMYGSGGIWTVCTVLFVPEHYFGSGSNRTPWMVVELIDSHNSCGVPGISR